jgi:hypothetical protein
VRTHDPIERRDYVDFLDANAGFDPVPYYKRIRDVDAPALDFLNVRFLVADPGRAAPSEKWRLLYSGADGTLFENARVLPRAFSPERIRLETPSPRPPTGLDWGREAVVRFEGSPPPLSGGATVSEYAERGNRVSFRADAPHASVVVTSLVDDGGWRARDDRGAAIRTGRANGPFLALAVPEGSRRIDLDYASPGFRAGARISLLAAAAALALAAIARARRTPRTESRA